jgi:hypothetical protein
MYARMRRIILAKNLISYPRLHSGDFFVRPPYLPAHTILYTSTASRLPSNGPNTGIQA